jgi:hypothetical protein
LLHEAEGGTTTLFFSFFPQHIVVVGKNAFERASRVGFSRRASVASVASRRGSRRCDVFHREFFALDWNAIIDLIIIIIIETTKTSKTRKGKARTLTRTAKTSPKRKVESREYNARVARV